MSDEFERIARLRKRLGSQPPQIDLGIGDDAALLSFDPQARGVWSIDTSVEGVHFERAWLSPQDIGFRAHMAALSDIAAMGARPRASLLSLIVPQGFAEDDFDALIEGCAQAAEVSQSWIVGGNLSAGDSLSLTTSVLGDIEGEALRREGAKAGERIWVSAPLGSAALGLACLQKEFRAPEAEAFLAAWRRPHAAIAQGRALLGQASAAIDLSDGLLQDLQHLCLASGVGAEIEVERLPSLPGARELALRLGLSWSEVQLRGGEEYALLWTSPKEVVPEFAEAYCIGWIREHAGSCRLRYDDGHVEEGFVGRGGHRHFDSGLR